MRNLLKALPLGAVLSVAALMLSTSPDALSSNFSKWLKFFGASDLPQWIVARSADHWLAFTIIGLSMIYAYMAWRIAFDSAGRRVKEFIMPLVAQARVTASLDAVLHRACDTPISSAIAHVRNAIHDLNTKEFWPDTRRVLRQHALDGILHIRGRREMPSVYSNEPTKFRDVHEDIPPDYWRDSQIDVCASSFNARDMAGSHTRPDIAKDWHPTDYTKALKHYADLRVNMDEVRANWPIKEP